MFHITLNTPIKPTSTMNSREIIHKQFMNQEGMHYKEAFIELHGNTTPIQIPTCIHFHTVHKPSEIRLMHLTKVETVFVTRPEDNTTKGDIALNRN